jgi:hypothetical protein
MKVRGTAHPDELACKLMRFIKSQHFNICRSFEIGQYLKN